MGEFFQSWGYLGVFLGIVITGVPLLPMPEELPVVLGGALAGSGNASVWIMLPLCILAVVLGDGMLYTIGRFWGRHLLKYAWISKHLLPPERLKSIEDNFSKHGIKILLFARLTPGFRSPIFFTAGLSRMSPVRFFLADGIYAIPGVTLLFFLGYWFSGAMVNLINNEMVQVRHILIVVLILGVAGYLLYRFLRRPVVTGDPQDIPKLTGAFPHTIKQFPLRVMRFILWAVLRLLLSLRYRVKVHGLEQVGNCKAGTLILPNHPAYIDPLLAFTSLWRTLQPRPLLFEGNFQNPLFHPLMKLLRAVPLPDMERPSAKARVRTDLAIKEVIEGLRKGENHILWPSGYLWRDGLERLGGAQAVGEILRAVPDANVVLVRTRGLWGSMTSFAPTGSRPNFFRSLRVGALLLLSNLLLFSPRRRVDITVERIDRGQLGDLGRDTLNPSLESWYNAQGPETPTYVPYHFLFGRRTYEFPPAGAEDPQLSQVTPETRAEVVQILERILKRKLTEPQKKPETVLSLLGMDSLDRMDVTLQVEQRFGFSTEQSPATLSDLWLLAQGLAKKAAAQPAPRAWFRPPSGEGKPEITGDTIAEAFVARALAHPSDVAAADDQAGVVTYGRLLTGALTLARRFAGLPGTNVGLLLPSSVASDMAFLALQLAGKVPVVLNWTTGPANLEQAVKLLELRHVVTSNLFIDRLEEKVVKAVKSSGAEILCLEDIRKEIGKWELLRTLLGVRLRPGRIRSQVPRVGADQPAVVLFTSGSEKAPKAVPLTHQNLLSNQGASLAVLGLTRKDSVLGFLPAFHSFGLSVTALLPLLSGLRVIHHPDPTAASVLARKIGTYQPTLMAGTPTFVNAILDRAAAKPEQLQSLRLICVGAERCPEELATKCRDLVPGAKLLEGYGITECAPVVSLNPPTAPRPGTVGQPLPNVEVCIVAMEEGDPEKLGEELPRNARGILLVSGPNVFPGYIGPGEKPPFLERGGKRWYITGDLAELDDDNYIHLAGRLKRFLKVGGEMISLPALEEPLARKYPPAEDRPRVAVEGTETPRRIVLFTTEDISLEAANDLLAQAGLRGIMRFDAVKRLEQIPTLGTGKVDNQSLRKLIQAGEPAKGASG